jgi:hypothetical protein
LGFIFCVRAYKRTLISNFIYLQWILLDWPQSGLCVVFLQISSINWWHVPFTFMVNELVCAAPVYLLNYIWPLPIWRNFWADVPANDRPFKDKNKLSLLKYPNARHFIVSPCHFCLIHFEILLGYQSLFIHGIQFVQSELLTFIHGHVILHSHP